VTNPPYQQEGLFLNPEEEALLQQSPPLRWSDRRVELLLGALVCVVIGLLLALVISVFIRAWPSFSHNGLSWFGAGDGSVSAQFAKITLSSEAGGHYVYAFHAWQIIWSTILITGGAIAISLFTSLFVAVFIVEFAPEWMRSMLQPVVRFLASVPSVIYGLIGVVVIVPFINDNLISEADKASVTPVVQLSGYSLMAGVLILSVMIAPLMTSIFCDGLRSIRPSWLEGSLALGVNRWRTTWKIAVHTARPAIVAGTVLALARALGEAVMLGMVTGVAFFSPNPADGMIFFFEPSTPLAATIIKYADNLSSKPAAATLFAIAAVLLFSAAMFSIAGWYARRTMRQQMGTT
jgi:phosphate transport system permease protein